jgi:acetoin utilization protein AcuB
MHTGLLPRLPCDGGGEDGRMLVGKRMTKNPVTVGPDDALAVADASMKAGNFRRLPVVDKGKLVGILSQYDLKNYRDSLASVLVKTAMTADPVTVSPSATLEHATSFLSKHKIGALPVVDKGKLVGIIVASDLWVPEPTARMGAAGRPLAGDQSDGGRT